MLNLMEEQFLVFWGKTRNLVGYDPKTTTTDKVPVVTAFTKFILSSYGQVLVSLKVNEAPYHAHSHITLLSDYQVKKNAFYKLSS